MIKNTLLLSILIFLLVAPYPVNGDVDLSFFSYPSELRGGYYADVGNLFIDTGDEIVTGTGKGFAPQVRVFNNIGNLKSQFYAYDESLRNGVVVTTCDFDGDGNEYIVTSQAKGGWPVIRIFDSYGNIINSGFYVLDGKFLGGINITCGDINGDNRDEIVAAAMSGGGPQVVVYSDTGDVIANFFAYDLAFRGGVNVTTMDMDGDGRDEIVTVPQVGISHVRIYQIRPDEIKLLSPGFFAFGTEYRGGASISGADTNGDGLKELLVASGSGVEPVVNIYNISEILVDSFLGYASTFLGGVRLAGGDIDGDAIDEIVVIPRDQGAPHVRVIDTYIPPKNIILFIGDGMGQEEIRAGSYFNDGTVSSLSFEKFLFKSFVTSYSADSIITDSAAAATAMATGNKVNNGVISVALPGSGNDLTTILEYYKSLGKYTGLVTTTSMTHATPAAFGAHATSRTLTTEIAEDYINNTKPNVLLGGGGVGMNINSAINAGYNVINNRDELFAIDTDIATYISGQFGTGHMNYEYDGRGIQPSLSDMTSTALNILDNNSDGFFLMVEGGRIDHAGHSNSINHLIYEVKAFSDAVARAIEWADDRRDTLIIVTADHETGGLEVLSGNGTGNTPSVTWSTGDHTSQNIPIYAWGNGASRLRNGIINNTDIYTLLKGGR